MQPFTKGAEMFLMLGLISALFIFSPPSALGQAYPDKPITIYCGFQPGATTDLTARTLAAGAEKLLGVPVVVENKPGGGATVAPALLATKKPDGYTLGAGSEGSITLAPHLEKMPYHPDTFTFIVQFGRLAYGYVVLPDSLFRTIKDVIEFARANPDKLTISTLGSGSFSHIPWEYLALVEGLKIRLVPFSGAAPAATALLGGHVMIASSSFTGFNPFLKAKKVRLLAVASDERLESFPDVPTMKELGYPLLALTSYHIVIGPKNMEKAIVTKLEEGFKKGMEAPSFIKANQELEMYERNPLGGDRLKEVMIRHYKTNEELAKKLGLKVKE